MKNKPQEFIPKRIGFGSVCTQFVFVMLFMATPFLTGCGDKDEPDHLVETGTVADIQGNIYKTIRIGNQWWMAEDLRSTFFANGEVIPNMLDKDDWAATTQPAYCIYNNNAPGDAGLLYNFHVIMSGNEIAPFGWRIPTDEDWKALEEYIGMPVAELDDINWRGSGVGDKLKAETREDIPGWAGAEGVWGTDDFGFSAYGGSCRVFSGEWGFPVTGHTGFWWCSTPSDDYGWFRYLDYQQSGIFRYVAHPNYGFSIRCVKN
jgi:uncharacterized protein (TIGR02145 family)